MSKKWWLATVLFFALAVGLVIAIPALMPPSPGVTYANYSRIEKGMTRAQLEAILGKPSADIPLRNFDAPEGSVFWLTTDDDVMIFFDEKGGVATAFWNGNIDERSGWQKLMDRVPWLSKPPPRMPVVIARRWSSS